MGDIQVMTFSMGSSAVIDILVIYERVKADIFSCPRKPVDYWTGGSD